MNETQHLGPQTHICLQDDVESLPLGELIPLWSSVLWLCAMRPMVQSMLQLDLTMSESLVLRQLRCQSMTIAEVASFLSITHSAASRVIDRLVQGGYLSRTENPEDRRQKLLALTDQGSTLMKDIESKFTAGIEILASRLSVEEQEQFRCLIAQMVVEQFAEMDAETNVVQEKTGTLSNE